MISLRFKLVATNLLLLSVAVASFGTVSYYGLSGLSARFSGLSAERSESVKRSYQETADQNIAKIRSLYEQALRDKGKRLLSKDSASLAPMIADNAFMGVKQFLQKTFEDDKDIVLATYFTVDASGARAWHFTSSAHPEGLADPVTYDAKRGGWQGTSLKGKKKVFVPDPDLARFFKLTEQKIEFKELAADPANPTAPKASGFDCVIPFAEGKTGASVVKARKSGDAVGYLRYVLSPNEMNRAIAAEQKIFEQRLAELESRNQAALRESQDVSAAETRRVLVRLAFGAGLIVLVGYLVSWIASIRISNPVKALTRVAQTMSQGDYSQEVTVKSNDEIGILATSFGEMSKAIRKRDADLAEINRNLEKTVELRTSQLNDENRKIAALLNSMKQAVFAVSNDLKVVPPVSRFSNSVFDGQIEGRSVLDFLYAGLDPKGEEMSRLRTAILAVFGEDDLQWGLMEANFPARIERRAQNGALQVLRVAYSPLFDSAGSVDKIMMVVEDITEMEKLAAEIRSQRERTAVLEQLTSGDQEMLKGFFTSAGNMLFEISSILRTGKVMAAELALIFRHLHTIKGTSRALGLDAIAKVTHSVESDVEPLRASVGASGLSGAEIEALRAGTGQVRAQFSALLKVASEVLGIENELEIRSTLEMHDVLSEVSWLVGGERADREALPVAVKKLAHVAGEANLGGLTRRAEAFSQALDRGAPDSELAGLWSSAASEGCAVFQRSPAFVEGSTLPSVWTALGLKLWAVSQAAPKGEGSSGPEFQRAVEDAWSHASASGLYFYAGYFRRMGNAPDSKTRLQLERELWRQYLVAGQYHSALKLNEADELECAKAFGLAMSDPGKATQALNGIARFGLWQVSLLRALGRRGIALRPFLETWADRTGVAAERFAAAMVARKSEWAEQRRELLLAILSGDSANLPGALRPEFEGILGAPRGNVYLRGLAACQMLTASVEDPELIRTRYRVVEVPEMNLNRLKEVVAEGPNPELVPAVNKLLELPVKPALWGYRRMITDVACRVGKSVRFEVAGDELTMHRDALYVLQDAIVHVLRNAIDHGIEEAEARKNASKPAEGSLTIACREVEDQLLIEIRDDGKGIDSAALAERAVSKGLLNRAEADRMNESQKLDLIFLAGFSTKESVTELSGRGVGMDVVKRNVESLGGSVEIRTRLLAGSTFSIRLPK